MDSARLVLDLMDFFTQMVRRILGAVERFGTEYDARSLEAYVEEQAKALAAVVLEACWRLRVKGIPVPESLPCVCGQRQHRKGQRPRAVRGMVGTLNLEDRYLFRCDGCGKRTVWGDELRGASNFTPLAEDRIAFAGKGGGFAEASESLRRLCGLEVAGSTVRKVCRRLGGRLRARTDREAAEQYGAGGGVPEEHPKRLAIGVDGVMLGRVDPQHRRRRSPKRGKVRGKTSLKNFFHEVKTLVIYEFDSAGKALRRTYWATQERVEAFREKVRLEAQKRGAELARELIFLGDGAPWVWKTAAELFPRAVQILDWYHALEHVWASARAFFGTREKELVAWVKEVEGNLWNGRLDEVVASMRELSRRLGTPDGNLSEQARAFDPRWIAYRNVGYFETNRDRMNYPEYRERKFPLSSGVVESTCKHVVSHRMKRAGMRWDEGGAEDIMALRCHDLNGRWDSLWEARRAG
jgi:hypothetical protein